MDTDFIKHCLISISNIRFLIEQLARLSFSLKKMRAPVLDNARMD